jgi:hypothetical protein
MSTMPGFTAEASLFRSRRSYSISAAPDATPSPTPVQMSRATGPYGPIGLPGQGCDAACWHICMTVGGGGFFDQCMASCRGSCTDFLSAGY